MFFYIDKKYLASCFIFIIPLSLSANNKIALTSPKNQHPKIVIIGAGLAGLTTAFRLHKHGIKTEIYEARNRVGGRVFTINVCDHIAELGAQNILDGGAASNIHNLINELGLETEQSQHVLNMDYFDGKKLMKADPFLEPYKFTKTSLSERLDAICKSAYSMNDVLQALFIDNEILYRYFYTLLAAYEGAIPENLSTYYRETLYHMLLGGLSTAHPSDNVCKEKAFITHCTVKGGNALIVQRMAESLSLPINFNSALKAVSRTSSNSYLLTFNTGKQVVADILVLAIPCSVYRDIKVSDDVIPSDRLIAIKNVSYGTNSKILIPIYFKEDQGAYTNGRMVAYYQNNFHTINGYYIGNNGFFDKSSIENTLKNDLPLLKMAFSLYDYEACVMAKDELHCRYFGPVGHCWPLDPYSKGSYSSIAPGQDGIMRSVEVYLDESVRSLFAPIDCLFFAGEHATCLMDACGTMEAAVESGERTARIILKKVSVK